jgi:Heavy metal binding domain
MMDTSEVFVLIGGTLLIAFTLWFFFGKREEESAATTDGQPVYECPMHPWITSTDPTANCSLCGMKLVKRGDAGAKHGAMEHGRSTPSHH